MCQADPQPQCPETSLLQDTQQRIHVLAFEDNPCGSTVYPGLLVSSSSIVPRGMESIEQVRALAKWHHTRSRQLSTNHRLNVVTVSVSLAADAQGEQVVLIPAHTQENSSYNFNKNIGLCACSGSALISQLDKNRSGHKITFSVGTLLIRHF